MDSTVEKLPPHVLLFPFPAHSHIHFLLNLAELLCHGGLHVTFLVADQAHRLLLNDAAVQSRFDQYPGFQFQNLRDGLLPVLDSQRPTLDETTEFGFSFLEVAKPRFKDVLTSSSSDWQKAEDSDHVARKSSIACIIADSMMASFAVDVAGEAGIPIMCYHNACPSDFWAVLCVPKLIEAGEIPFQGDDLDVPIANVPGLEGLLRRRDLSSFLRVGDLSDKNTQFIINGASQTHRACMILNTFEELEGPALAQIRSQGTNIYTVGPLHEHLKTRLTSMIPPNNLKKEDTGCITWLDAQPLRSVIYDTCDRVMIEKMIKELMDTRRVEFTQSANQIAKLAKNTVSKGGSSYINLDRLIEDIRSLDTD
ncbi:hypothetical protein RHGRI_027591 [Rhododendron griersonianum]|uniref:Uncharacterized protein n=1 Tax=Rhododendron griersonianum TaxID=479676 RepID=A0AAV6J267_9ERIC|nr:hypothetical protein RHGRI_027591 [Rhododendron griersonianum]